MTDAAPLTETMPFVKIRRRVVALDRRAVDDRELDSLEADELAHVAALEIGLVVEDARGLCEELVARVGRRDDRGAKRLAREHGNGVAVDEKRSE
jgi:hypothetical protein